MNEKMIQKLNEEALSMPKDLEQDGLGEKAIVHAHLFSILSGWDWYLLEYDKESEIFFALVSGYEREYGSVPKKELEKLISLGTVEMDMYFTKKELGSVMHG